MNPLQPPPNGRRFLGFMCVLVICLVSTPGYGQRFGVKRYTTNTGLPSNYIFTAFESRENHLWIGTINGASRFNGTTFTNFGREVDLSSFSIRRILQDSQGNIWLGAENEIVKFDNGKSTHFKIADSTRVSFTFDIVETPEGKIWWLTAEGTFELQAHKWVKIMGRNTAFTPRHIVFDNKKTVTSYGDKLLIKDQLRDIVISSPVQPYSPYYRLLRKCNNKILVSTNFALFEMVDNRLLPICKDLVSEEKRNFIYWFSIDKQNRTWLATEHGIFVSFPASEKFFKLPIEPTMVSDINHDALGNTWISGSDGLIKVYESLTDRFEFGKEYDIASAFSSSEGILVGMVDKGTENSGLHVVKNNLLEPHPDSKLLRYERIDSYTEDGKGNVWVSTRSSRIYHITKDAIEFVLGANQSYWLPSVVFDPGSGGLYYASNTLMFWKDNKSTKVEYKGMRIERPSSIFIDSGGTVWVGCVTGKIYCIRDRVIQLMNDALEVPMIAHAGKILFQEDQERRIWMSYPGLGLRRFIVDKDKVTTDIAITTSEGLSNNFIESLAIDKKGNLWALTDAGPCFIKVLDEEPRIMMTDLSHFVNEDNWLQASLSSMSFGQVLLQTPKAIYMFDAPSKFLNNPPTTVIREIEVISPNSETKLSIPATGTSLQHDQNSIVLKYEAVSLADQAPVFVYRLATGNDGKWSTPSKIPSIVFANLEPGEYVFEVKSRLPNSVWSESKTATFRVLPPFYKSWWFRLLASTLVISAIVLGIKVYTNGLKSRQKIETEIASLEARALKAQMNPHFVFNAMNSIQSLVASDKGAQALKYISKFSKLLRFVLENAERNFISLEREINSLHLYIQLEALRLHVNFDYEILVSSNIDASEELIPPMMVQPYVENALWHGLSPKDSDRKLTIHFSADEDFLFCEIVDNGIGRAKAGELKQKSESQHQSKGQSITERRLALLNDVTDQSVSTTDLYSSSGKATGTKVRLRIRRNTVPNDQV